MNEPLKLLLIEDSEDDAFLLLRDLRLAGFDVHCRRVQTEAEMATALEREPWDAIISDFNLPSFNGSAALALARASGQDIPFLIVSGSLGEELAVEVMRAGAHDYLMKNNLRRLPEALRRELREARGRRERQRLEEQLRQRQKLETIGALAGGVAHDFNNILTGIFGYLHLARQSLADRPAVCADLDEIESASVRAKDLVRQILEFSRRESAAIVPLCLGSVTREVMRLLRASLPSTIRLNVTIPASLPPIMGSATGIHQVLMNLCTNAAQAINGAHGTIRVSLSERTVPDPGLAGLPELPAGTMVVLEVSDTGCGMDEATQRRIFEPFFTTKSADGGTGLGLATVVAIVRNHQGAVRVQSASGQGSSFQVLFPAATGGRKSAASPGGIVIGRGQTVLVVDDEPTLAHAMARALTQLNYRPVVLNSSRQAAQELSGHPDNFQLLVCDLTMPEMNGLELIQEARRICPGLPIILTSGSSDRLDSDEVRQLGVNGTLPKPYSFANLAELVAFALGSPGLPGAANVAS